MCVDQKVSSVCCSSGVNLIFWFSLSPFFFSHSLSFSLFLDSWSLFVLNSKKEQTLRITHTHTHSRLIVVFFNFNFEQREQGLVPLVKFLVCVSGTHTRIQAQPLKSCVK